MSILTKINQRESLGKVEIAKPVLYTKILAELSKTEEGLTAREIAKLIGLNTRQDTQPRLTELTQMGLVRENGRKFDNVTLRNVTKYILTQKEEK